MSHWCESCGQEMPDGDAQGDALWLEVPGLETPGRKAPGDQLGPAAGTTGTIRSGRDKKLLLVLGGALALWALFVGIGRFVSPADSVDEQAASDLAAAEQQVVEREAVQQDEQASADVEVAEDFVPSAEAHDAPEQGAFAEALSSGPIVPPEGDYAAADAAPGVPLLPGDESMAVQAERLQLALTQSGTAAVVVYRSAVGIVAIDLSDGDVVTTAFFGRPDEDREFDESFIDSIQAQKVLRSGPRTYGIDPQTLQASLLATDSSIIVTDARDGAIYTIDGPSRALEVPIVAVHLDGESRTHRSPGGSQMLPIDGLGLVAVPRTQSGATLIAGESEFVELSENRVLTANATARIEQVCADAMCSIAVTNHETRASWTVPSDFVRLGDQLVIAPDGSSLVQHSPEGFATVLLSDGSAMSLDGNGVEAPRWGPDSRFLAWIDRIDTPELNVLFPSNGLRYTIDLEYWGAPKPITADLLIFERETE